MPALVHLVVERWPSLAALVPKPFALKRRLMTGPGGVGHISGYPAERLSLEPEAVLSDTNQSSQGRPAGRPQGGLDGSGGAPQAQWPRSLA